MTARQRQVVERIPLCHVCQDPVRAVATFTIWMPFTSDIPVCAQHLAKAIRQSFPAGRFLVIREIEAAQ